MNCLLATKEGLRSRDSPISVLSCGIVVGIDWYESVEEHGTMEGVDIKQKYSILHRPTLLVEEKGLGLLCGDRVAKWVLVVGNDSKLSRKQGKLLKHLIRRPSLCMPCHAMKQYETWGRIWSQTSVH